MQRPVLRLLSSHLRKRRTGSQETGYGVCCPLANLSTQTMAADLKEMKPVLVRDYIHSALYDPDSGYFAARAEAVGALMEPICFNLLQGRKAYLQCLDNLYKQNGVAWFTPVEVFQPWYGYAIAEYILRTLDPTIPLKIYEIGGGTGTCASGILDYIRAKAPPVYKSMSYTSVEISAALALKQQHRVGRVKSHCRRFHVNCGSGSDPSPWGAVDGQTCFVIMLEVLDNLPHDLVYRETPTSAWMETWVSHSYSGINLRTTEERRILKDPLIERCLDVIAQSSDGSSSLARLVSAARTTLSRFISLSELSWIPTGCLQLLENLHRTRPNMVLIAADFSCLPGVKVTGARAPLVASKEEGQTRDHSTYLEAKGDVDIFFPTDFQLLQHLDQYAASHCGSPGRKHTSNRMSSVVSSAEFMEQCADTKKTKTQDGFNPLLEDYSNTKFYISLPK